MSVPNDGWTGVRDGSFRGRRLSICAKGHCPITYTDKACPICEAHERIATLITSIKSQQDARCKECQKRAPINGREVAR